MLAASEESRRTRSLGTASPRFGLALLLLLLLLGWLWIWGDCWNPWRTSCFLQPAGHGDPVQHFLGWRAYAAATPPSLIPPLIDRWTWPQQVPLLYADAIPLAAILLRPLQNLVGQPFQYFSLLSLASILATGVIGHRIGWLATGSAGCAFCLGLSLGLAPPMVMRTFSHEALSLQVLVVGALYLLIRRDGRFWPWALLLAVSAGVHPYLVAILLPLLAIRLLSPELPASAPARSLQRLLTPLLGGWRPPARLLEACLIVAVLLVAARLYGYGSGAEVVTDPVWSGSWSANVLSLLDSANLSPIVPPIGRHMPFQVEGVAYPGLFVILSAPVLMLLGRRRSVSVTGLFPSPPLFWGVMASMLVFAWGTTWYVGPHALLDLEALRSLPVLGALWRTLRSSGRFVWPVFYALTIWAFCSAWSLSRARWWRSLLVVVVLLSLVESHQIPMQAAHNHFLYRQRPLTGSIESVPAPLVAFARIPGSHVINISDDPDSAPPQIPSMTLQRLAPAVITNHAPHLARFLRRPEVAEGANDCERLGNLIAGHPEIVGRTMVLAKVRGIEGCRPQPGWLLEAVVDLPPEHRLLRVVAAAGSKPPPVQALAPQAGHSGR